MKVLVAYDGTPAAYCALKFSGKIANSVDDLLLLYVIPPVVGAPVTFDSFIPSSVYQSQSEIANGIVSLANKTMQEMGIKGTVLTVDAAGELVPRVILKVAKEKSVDLIITGTRRLKGLSKVILGSVSSELVSISDIPVTVVPREED